MDKLRIDKFSGLYTNANEASLNPEYQREAFNVRFKAGSMISDGYSQVRLEDVPDVIYCGPVALDADRLGNKIEGDKLVRDYKQNLEYFLLVIRQYSIGPPTASQGYRLQIHTLSGEYLDIAGHILAENLEFYKIWNDKGIVLVLTNAGVYWLGKIHRTIRFDTNSTYDGFFLRKLVKNEFDASVGNIETLIDPPKDFIPVTLSLISVGEPYIIQREWRKEYVVRVVFDSGRLQSDYRFLGRSVWEVGEGGPYYIDQTAYDAEKFKENIVPLPLGNYWVIENILGIIDPKGKYTFDISDMFLFNKAEFLLTYISNSRDEYPISYFEHVMGKQGILQLDTFRFEGVQSMENIPSDPLITSIVLYMRGDEKDDFQQVHTWDLNLGEIIPDLFSTLYIDNRSFNGIYATQTIGTLYKKEEYSPIDTLTDYTEIDGIAFGVNGNRIYFPAVGSGEIMNGVFLDYIPEAEGKFIANVNGALGVFSTQLDLITIQDSREGYLLFSSKDSMNFTIRDQYDLAYSPEGILIHTPTGIYATNGYERTMISEPINDVIERNYETGNIFYNSVDDLLFYLCAEGSWRYDFIYSKWDQLLIKVPSLPWGYNHIRGILAIGDDGKIYQTLDKKVYKLMQTSDITSIIYTPKVDLDYPSVAKSVTYMVFDFVGKLMLSVRDQLEGEVLYDITHTARKAAMLGVPVGMRVPAATLGSAFSLSGEIYSIEIYYDILGEFRNADFIPTPETYFKRPSQLTELLAKIRKETKASA